MQRRSGRPSDMTGRPISGNGHGNGNGNGSENGAHAEANGVDTMNGSDYAEGSNGAEAAETRAEMSAENGVDVVEIPSFTNGSNGSNGVHKAETASILAGGLRYRDIQPLLGPGESRYTPRRELARALLRRAVHGRRVRA